MRQRYHSYGVVFVHFFSSPQQREDCVCDGSIAMQYFHCVLQLDSTPSSSWLVFHRSLTCSHLCERAELVQNGGGRHCRALILYMTANYDCSFFY